MVSTNVSRIQKVGSVLTYFSGDVEIVPAPGSIGVMFLDSRIRWATVCKLTRESPADSDWLSDPLGGMTALASIITEYGLTLDQTLVTTTRG